MWSEVRVPRADGGSGAARESGAHGADTGADSADQSNPRVAGDLGLHLARASAGRLVDHGAGLAGVGPGGRSASAARPRGGAPRAGGGADRGAQCAAAGGGDRGGARERGASARAAERDRHDQCVGVARRGVGVAGVPESAGDRRAAGVRADALFQRRDRRASKGSVAPAMNGCKRSVLSSPGIGCGGNPAVRSRSGSGHALGKGNGRAGSGLSRWPASFWSRCGGMSPPASCRRVRS